MRPWTALTYTFLHADFMHLLFNMIGLFFFGPRLEERLGGRDFLILYFGSGMGGAILSFIFAPASAVVGASGAVFGVLLGFAYFWPRENIHIWGVIPIQARWLAILLVAVSLYFGFSSGRSSIAHFAHLGGLVLAFGYLKIRERLIRMKAEGSSERVQPTPQAQAGGRVRASETVEGDRPEVASPPQPGRGGGASPQGGTIRRKVAEQ